MSARWRNAPERSHRLALVLMRAVALGLGRRAARALLPAIAAYYLAFTPRARRASRDYLARALGRAPRLADLYRHFFTFAASVLDRVYLLNGRFDLFRFELHGVPAEPAGLLLAGAHFGSFEALRAVGRHKAGLRITMVKYEDNARMVNEALAAISPAAQLDVIPLGRVDSMLRVRDALAAGAVVGVLADRQLDDEHAVSLPFLGAPASFPLGPMRMAELLRCRVHFMAGVCLGGNRYALHFEPLADFGATPRPEAQAALRAYVACLERHCRAAPYNWFNFYDFRGERA
jgi:predicted LPLAT superfamily acyltransferase